MATDILKNQHPQMENDQLNQLISQQKDQLVSLDREIAVAGSRIQERSTFPGGILVQQGKHNRLRKHIRILEDKLEEDTAKFDELLFSNMDYSKDIAHLLQQKSIGCKIEEKFNRQMALEQNRMETQKKKSILAFKQRSEAQTRMLKMSEMIKLETVQFIKRQNALKVVIDHDTKLHTFMEGKLKEMIPLGDDEDYKKRKRQQQYEEGVKKLEMYIQGHSTLVEVTGERDLCQIGHMFIQTEQKNFSHVNYINEQQNRRKSMLKERTDKIKSEILFLEQVDKGHEEQSRSQLKDLESELKRYNCLADSLEEQCAVVQKTLDQLKTAINELEMMHEPVIFTRDNIAQFTRTLEDSIINLLMQSCEQMEVAPQNLLLANFDLLPEYEAVVEREHRRSPSCSVKSAGSDTI